MAQKNFKSKVVTGEVRFSYAHVFQPWGDVDPKYSVVAVIDKSNTKAINAIKEGIKAVLEQERDGMFRGINPKSVAIPLKDGDNPADGREPNPSYEGSYYIGANRKTAPGIIDKNKRPIIDQDEFYSGCYGYISITLAPYSVNGKVGVKAYLNHIMKTRDGERLGSASTAEFDFADVEVTEQQESDDFLF